LQDARRHHIEVRPVDVRYSDWDCSLEPLENREYTQNLAIRMGLRMIRGLPEEDGRRIERVRQQLEFRDVTDLCVRADLDNRARALLADSGALRGLVGHRHRARWEIAGVEVQRPLFGDDCFGAEAQVVLPLPSVAQDLKADYDTLGTTLGPHPLALLRNSLAAKRFRSAKDLLDEEHGRNFSVAGLVVGRQRPGTASGVTFVTLEDEHGTINVVVWRDLAERQRKVLVGSQLLQVFGKFEFQNGVRHVIAQRLFDLTPLLTGLDVRSRDFK
jgi:error-prone DNA polymerase